MRESKSWIRARTRFVLNDNEEGAQKFFRRRFEVEKMKMILIWLPLDSYNPIYSSPRSPPMYFGHEIKSHDACTSNMADAEASYFSYSINSNFMKQLSKWYSSLGQLGSSQ